MWKKLKTEFTVPDDAKMETMRILLDSIRLRFKIRSCKTRKNKKAYIGITWNSKSKYINSHCSQAPSF